MQFELTLMVCLFLPFSKWIAAFWWFGRFEMNRLDMPRKKKDFDVIKEVERRTLLDLSGPRPPGVELKLGSSASPASIHLSPLDQKAGSRQQSSLDSKRTRTPASASARGSHHSPGRQLIFNSAAGFKNLVNSLISNWKMDTEICQSLEFMASPTN